MKTADMKSESSHSLFLSLAQNTQKDVVRESAESQRSGFPGLCSLPGWLEVMARVSQLTGSRSDWNTEPAHRQSGLCIAVTV